MKAQKIDELRRQIELIPPDVYDVAERKNRENAIALEQRRLQPAPVPAADEGEIEITALSQDSDQADNTDASREAFGDWLRDRSAKLRFDLPAERSSEIMGRLNCPLKLPNTSGR